MTLQHLSDETPEECPECQSRSGLTKLLTTFSTRIRQEVKHKVGETTERFIKDARSELEAQKLDLPKNKS